MQTLTPAVLAGAAITAFLLAAIVVGLGRRFANRTLARLDAVADENRALMQARAHELVKALAFVAFGVAAAATLALVLSQLRVGLPEWTPRQVLGWTLSHGLRALVILAIAWVALRVSNLAIDRFKYQLAGDPAKGVSAERARRAATLGSIVASLVTAAIFFLAGLMVLRELSIDVLPLLTGAGIAGLAIGFGAQNLVRDVISGFFIILEDQVGVGDVARIQNVTGVIEQVRLRTIALRDEAGTVHVFPNGTVTTIANLTRDFAYATADVVVAHGENLDRAMAALRMIGAGMQDDPAIQGLLLGPFEVLGVQELRESSLTVRVRFRTQPSKQWQVAAELRRRIAVGLAARDIKPFKSVQ
ncbi:MAG TPA: mechanosensitive ion channel family protein [Vicinamibacterales bacterium]|nr:mechanosensitive ion channel family protein [Vicinamibacterales bacterium]